MMEFSLDGNVQFSVTDSGVFITLTAVSLLQLESFSDVYIKRLRLFAHLR